MFSSRKNPYLPQGRSLETPRTGGSQKTNVLKESLNPGISIGVGGRTQTKETFLGEGRGGGIWIISGTTQ